MDSKSNRDRINKRDKVQTVSRKLLKLLEDEYSGKVIISLYKGEIKTFTIEETVKI